MKRTIIKERRFCEVVQRCRRMKRGSFVVTKCAWCPFWFARYFGRGRPAIYCSDDCAKYARAEQRRYGKVSA